MDYTLVCTYADGTFFVQHCSTMTDVSNEMHSVMRSQERPDLPHKTVQFTVQFNHKK